MTRSSPRTTVDMLQDGLEFTQLGEFKLSKVFHIIFRQTARRFFKNIFFNLGAYKENHVKLHTAGQTGHGSPNDKVRAKVVRPNIECTDGYIHIIDTAMIDDTPPWTILANQVEKLQMSMSILTMTMIVLLITL